MMIHTLAAKKLIRDLEEGKSYLHGRHGGFVHSSLVNREIVKLGVKYGLVSTLTSYVAVNEPQKQEAMEKDIKKEEDNKMGRSDNDVDGKLDSRRTQDARNSTKTTLPPYDDRKDGNNNTNTNINTRSTDTTSHSSSSHLKNKPKITLDHKNANSNQKNKFNILGFDNSFVPLPPMAGPAMSPVLPTPSPYVGPLTSRPPLQMGPAQSAGPSGRYDSSDIYTPNLYGGYPAPISDSNSDIMSYNPSYSGHDNQPDMNILPYTRLNYISAETSAISAYSSNDGHHSNNNNNKTKLGKKVSGFFKRVFSGPRKMAPPVESESYEPSPPVPVSSYYPLPVPQPYGSLMQQHSANLQFDDVPPISMPLQSSVVDTFAASPFYPSYTTTSDDDDDENPQSHSLTSLILLQKFNGSFNIDDLVSHWISSRSERLPASFSKYSNFNSNDFISTYKSYISNNVNYQGYLSRIINSKELLGTLLALVILETDFSNEKEDWELLHEKGIRWGMNEMGGKDGALNESVWECLMDNVREFWHGMEKRA
jgi:hypothetical protein